MTVAWRLMNEEGALWRQIIAVKFGVDKRGWFTCMALWSHGKSLWKKIGAGKERFLNCIRWNVGRSDRIRFWED